MVNANDKIIILYDFLCKLSFTQTYKNDRTLSSACWRRAFGFLRYNLFGDTVQKNMQGTKLVRECELKCIPS